jgi:hypothetical protein
MGRHKKIERERELDRKRRRRKKRLTLRKKTFRQPANPAVKKGH